MHQNCYKSRIIDREADKHKVIWHGHLDQSSPIIPRCFDNIPISPCGPCTLAHSTITAAEKPSVAGYGSQIEFAH